MLDLLAQESLVDMMRLASDKGIKLNPTRIRHNRLYVAHELESLCNRPMPREEFTQAVLGLLLLASERDLYAPKGN